MNQKIKELIINVLNDLNYDNTDEELFKYLYEKGSKAIKLFEDGEYSIEQIRQLLTKNIPNMMIEYQRFKNVIDKQDKMRTKFGTSINYQIIDLFEILKMSSSSEDFEKQKLTYLNQQPKIFPGIKECTYNEISNIYKNIVERCDCITPEAEAKMTLTIREDLPLFNENGEINKNLFDFNYLDKIVNFASENEMQVRLHTLVWHKHFPKILENCSREDCLKFLDTYFSIIASRYGEEKFSSIDVINEICADIKSEKFKKGQILRESPWKKVLGDKYYLDVLKLARKNFSNCNLVYNEYDETNPNKRKNMISLINDIKLEESVLGVKLLDSVGLQSHYHEYTTDEEIKKTYIDLIQTGKKLQVSELDITKITKNDDMQVNRVARTVLDCASTYDIDYITCWGPSSKISWKSNKVRTFLDDNGNIDQSINKISNIYSMKNKIKEKSNRTSVTM